MKSIYVFSAHTMLTTFCAPFPDRIFHFGHALGLCALFIVDTDPRESCVSHSLEVGITFLILSYSKAEKQKCLSRCAV